MSYRNLDLTIISAECLKTVSRFSKMQTYAVVWIDGGHQRLSTHVDKHGGVNPSWNQSLSFAVRDYVLQQQPEAHLNIEMYSKGFILGDKFVGLVRIPLSEIMQSSGKDIMSYQVRRRSGKAKGLVKLSIRLGVKVEAPTSSLTEPVMAYPPFGHKPQQGYYPPPPQQPMYGGYQAYPPQPQYQPYAGQNYYPPQQQYYPPRRPGMVGGMGTGLLAGALGGLLVGEMVNDITFDNGGGYNNFDNSGGYDNFDSGGGFDGGDMGF